MMPKNQTNKATGNIERNFQEDAINEMTQDMEDELPF
jgi:hypothetical protein